MLNWLYTRPTRFTHPIFRSKSSYQFQPPIPWEELLRRQMEMGTSRKFLLEQSRQKKKPSRKAQPLLVILVALMFGEGPYTRRTLHREICCLMNLLYYTTPLAMLLDWIITNSQEKEETCPRRMLHNGAGGWEERNIPLPFSSARDWTIDLQNEKYMLCHRTEASFLSQGS